MDDCWASEQIEKTQRLKRFSLYIHWVYKLTKWKSNRSSISKIIEYKRDTNQCYEDSKRRKNNNDYRWWDWKENPSQRAGDVRHSGGRKQNKENHLCDGIPGILQKQWGRHSLADSEAVWKSFKVIWRQYSEGHWMSVKS